MEYKISRRNLLIDGSSILIGTTYLLSKANANAQMAVELNSEGNPTHNIFTYRYQNWNDHFKNLHNFGRYRMQVLALLAREWRDLQNFPNISSPYRGLNKKRQHYSYTKNCWSCLATDQSNAKARSQTTWIYASRSRQPAWFSCTISWVAKL